MLFALVGGGLRAQTPAAASALADEAYALMASKPAEAIELFRRSLAEDPSNVMVRRQLGYLCLSQNRHEEALEHFTLADGLLPSDTTKLQRAYILASLGRPNESTPLFQELAQSPLADVRLKAETELSAVSTGGAPSRHWTHLYAAPYYDTRWKTLFYQAHIQHGYDLTDDRRFSAYGKASISGDNKSQGVGLAPLIISDNTLLLAVGVRVKPLAGLMIDVQEGLAFDLIDKGSGMKTRGDFRAVAVYGTGIYAPFSVHPELTMPMTPFADLYASAGYYSRYTNGIAYAQGRLGLHALEVKRTSADVYARLDLVGDTERLFYNNLAEIGVGFRLTPNVDWGLHFVAEYHRGFYLDVSAAATAERTLLYDAAYHSGRFFLIYERTL